MTERVQKVLSQWGIASRRKAERMILANRVKLNGQTVKLGDQVDLTVDTLEVDGKAIKLAQRPQKIYLLLNKPVGVVSSCHDPQKRPTVLDLLPANLKIGQGIHPVGRLDLASSGALLLTNDGDFTLGLTHPRYHLPKTYRVLLNHRPTEKDLLHWRTGVILDGQKTLPAKVNVIQQNRQQTLLKIILTEGKNRQIRRIAEKLGFKVVKLHRIAIGSIAINCKDRELPCGNYRHLTVDEIKLLQNCFDPTLKLAAPSGSAVYGRK